jgi:hypothetical protein
MGASVVLILLIQSFVLEYQIFTKKEMIVYNDKDNSMIQFRNGHQSVWLTNSYNDGVKKYIEHAKNAMQSKENQLILIDSMIRQSKGKGLKINKWLWVRGNFIQFNNKKLVIASERDVRNKSGYPECLDYLIVWNAKRVNAKVYPAKMLMTGSSDIKASKIENANGRGSMADYNIIHPGALRIEL